MTGLAELSGSGPSQPDMGLGEGFLPEAGMQGVAMSPDF